MRFPIDSTSHRTARRRAFTLLEMIVVVVILGIMATIMVPKLFGNDKREFSLAVDRTADLLTLYAQRHTLGQKMIGIYHDRANNTLMLVQLDADATGRASGWSLDRYVDPVLLPRFMVDTDLDIIADGDRYDADQWPLTSDLGKERPIIEIRMRGAGETASIMLYPHGVAPLVFGSTVANNGGVMRAKVDLDGMGRSREDW